MSSAMQLEVVPSLPSCSVPSEITVQVNGPDDALQSHQVYLVQAFHPDGSKKQRLWQVKEFYQGSRNPAQEPVGPYDREHGWRVCDVPRSRWRAKDANTYKIDASQNEGQARTGEMTVKGVVDAARDRSASKRKRKARSSLVPEPEEPGYTFCGEAFRDEQDVLDAISRQIDPTCDSRVDMSGSLHGGKVRFLGQLWPSFTDALHGLGLMAQSHTLMARGQAEPNKRHRGAVKEERKQEFRLEASAEGRLAAEVAALKQQLAWAQHREPVKCEGASRLVKQESSMTVKLEQFFMGSELQNEFRNDLEQLIPKPEPLPPLECPVSPDHYLGFDDELLDEPFLIH